MASPMQQMPVPPGRMVKVGGFHMHAIVCGQGTPVVLFEPALGGFALQYSHIQSAVSAFTQVMAYDRLGQGWSDASPNPRTPENLVSELRDLLNRLDLHPPYVLVGHSFGGLLSRIFAMRYPAEVCGVVLVDSTHVDEYNAFPSVDKFVRQAAVGVRLLKFASRVGLGKQVAKLSLGPAAKSLSKDDLETFLSVLQQPKHHETMIAEFSQHQHYFGAQSEVPDTLGSIPLIVITAGNSVSGRGKIGGLTAEQINEQHQRLQKDLLHLSSHSEQVIIPGADHLSILTQPEYSAQVADAVQRLVKKTRENF